MVRRNFTSTAQNLQPSWEDWFKGSPIMVTHVAKSSSTLIFLIPLHRRTSALCQKCCLSSSWIVLSVLVLRLPNEMETSELQIWPFPILSPSQGSFQSHLQFRDIVPMPLWSEALISNDSRHFLFYFLIEMRQSWDSRIDRKESELVDQPSLLKVLP